MNEQIQLLAEVAAGHYCETFHWEYKPQIDKDIFKKFAELIINQCIFEMIHESYLQPNKEVQDFTVRVSERVKQHFGVE